MSLNDSQLVIFKAALDSETDPIIVQGIIDGTNIVIADWYNDQASPDFFLWRSDISVAEVKDVVDWSEYIGRSNGERAAFSLLIEDGIVNATKPNVRSGFTDIFSGPNGANTRTALTDLAKRLASRIEKELIVSGTGTNGDPGTPGFEGNITRLDVAAALAL